MYCKYKYRRSNLSAIADFANIYLGAHASNPTTDTDGSALEDGDLYFNTTSNVLKFFQYQVGGSLLVRLQMVHLQDLHLQYLELQQQ